MQVNESYESYKNSNAMDYIELLKPRVMFLSIFTSACGIILNPNSIHPFLGIMGIVCIAMGAGASGCINMWIERYIDGKMSRTKNRPIPSGRVSSNEALALGVFLSVFSVTMIGLFVNILSALLLAFTIFFYCVIYTIYLKPNTTQNIVIGGLAGALPPVIGWSCSSDVNSLMPWVLMLIIFLWTPPHFWALSMTLEDDYKNAKYPMMSIIKGKSETNHWIMIYTLTCVISSLIPLGIGYGGIFYFIISISFGMFFIFKSAQLMKYGTNKKAMELFLFSIIYLFVIFLSLTVENFVINKLAP